MSRLSPKSFTGLLCSITLLASSSAVAQTSQSDQAIRQELKQARTEVLAKRPYKLDPSTIKEVINVAVAPSQQLGSTPPDWWSEKQAYDIASLLSIALSNYPSFRVITPQTWEEHLVDQNTSLSAAPMSSQPTGKNNFLDSRTITAQINILDYAFQYMPVKRRGIGLGFIALTSKECSSETFLKSEASIQDTKATSSQPDPTAIASGLPTGAESLLESQSVLMNRRIINTTGGASLNFNFLVGGAGGGNFNPPDKPLKQMIYESVADAAEAIYCLATDQKACIAYYRTRAQPLPTKLTNKQRKKVQSC